MRHHLLVVANWVDLSEVIRFVGFTGLPEGFELAFFHTILDPVVPHCHGLQASNPDGFLGASDSSRIVAHQRGPMLGIAQVLENILVDACLLTCQEEGAIFGFTSRRENIGHDFG